MLKKIIFVSLIIVVLIIAIIRFSSPEDNWICQNGFWVKHGNPRQNQPTTLCPSTPTENNQVACTMEAKLCPDGSSVGRSGPKCEFATCPE